MKKILILVDMQKDFVDGVLGTKEAVEAARIAAEKIRAFKGDIIATFDTHDADYMTTREGRYLPVPHCIEGTPGFELYDAIADALKGKAFISLKKPVFGNLKLPEIVEILAGGEEFSLEVYGFCTDICVISNVLILKAAFPEIDITVDSACVAGVTPEKNAAALDVMSSCQVIIA